MRGFFTACLVLLGCGIYSPYGASTSGAKTCSVAPFDPVSPYVSASAALVLTESLRDRIQRQSTLRLVDDGGELTYRAEVVDWNVSPINIQESDPVAVAERLLGAPYVWGGNSAFGIDCSGLVQIACHACGITCPGDSDLQMAQLGETLDPGTPPQRGDLLFWKGHVGWVSDSSTLLHANAHSMSVTHEPLQAAIERIAAQGDPILRHARLTLR